MTQEEIIALAREAGITFVTEFGVASATPEFLTHFADLVAAREREACAQVCEQSDRYRGSYFAQKIRARGQP